MDVQELRQAREISQVAYTEFVLYTKRGKDGLFCFFEGNDNVYYIPRIKRFTENYYPINCGNRDKVLDVHRLIKNHPEYNKYKKAFFIDRDFNNPLTKQYPLVFETPCYSIENFYVTVETFKEILKNEFHLPEVSETGKSEFETCVELYLKRQIEFHEAALLFNAWYSCLYDLRITTGKKTGVNLDDKFPKDFIEITLDEIRNNYDFGKIQDTFPDALQITDDALKSKLEIFSKCEKSKTFRGKYELQFLTEFVEKLLQDSSKYKKYLKKKVKFSFGEKLSNIQAMSIFTNYAETPDSLIKYLAKVTK